MKKINEYPNVYKVFVSIAKTFGIDEEDFADFPSLEKKDIRELVKYEKILEIYSDKSLKEFFEIRKFSIDSKDFGDQINLNFLDSFSKLNNDRLLYISDADMRLDPFIMSIIVLRKDIENYTKLETEVDVLFKRARKKMRHSKMAKYKKQKYK